MKVSDAINECMYYPYSREHYELTKAAYRVSLMEQFIESQRFIGEIQDYNTAALYESGAFGDRVSDSLLDEVITEAGDDKVNLWDRIIMGSTKIIQWIKDLFFKMSVRFDKSMKMAGKLATELKGKKIGKELYDKLDKICLDALDAGKQNFKPALDQPDTLELSYLNDVDEDDRKTLTSRLTAGLAVTKVKADSASDETADGKEGDEKKPVIYGIPPTELVQSMYEFVKDKNVKAEDLRKKFDELAAKSSEDGLEIEVNPKAIEDMGKRLGKINDHMEVIQNKTKGRSSSSTSSDTNTNESEEKKESYEWYDFEPENIYEGFYDDWDPVYGDPFIETAEGDAVKAERARKKALKTQARINPPSEGSGSFKDMSQKANASKKTSSGGTPPQNAKGSPPKQNTKSIKEAIFDEILKSYEKNVAPLLKDKRYQGFNEKLDEWREEAKKKMANAKIADAERPVKIVDLMNETKNPKRDTTKGITEEFFNAITKIRKGYSDLSNMKRDDPNFDKKVKELQKIIQGLRKNKSRQTKLENDILTSSDSIIGKFENFVNGGNKTDEKGNSAKILGTKQGQCVFALAKLLKQDKLDTMVAYVAQLTESVDYDMFEEDDVLTEGKMKNSRMMRRAVNAARKHSGNGAKNPNGPSGKTQGSSGSSSAGGGAPKPPTRRQKKAAAQSAVNNAIQMVRDDKAKYQGIISILQNDKKKDYTWRDLQREPQGQALIQALNSAPKDLQKYYDMMEKYLKQNPEQNSSDLGEFMKIASSALGGTWTQPSSSSSSNSSSNSNSSSGSSSSDSDTSTNASSGDSETEAVDTKNLNEVYAILKKYTGVTMNIYVGYANYRQKIIEGLSVIFNLGDGEKKEEGNNDKEQAS